MRNSLIFLTITLLPLFGYSQHERYTKAMTEIIAQLDTVRTEASLQEIDNRLTRIGQAEKQEWLPDYYRALTHIKLAMAALEAGQTDRIEAHARIAQEALDRALERNGDASEIAALQAYIHMTYLWTDPMANGPRYAGLVHQSLNKAIALDDMNPRAPMLMGMMLLYTPPSFGGGAQAALPHLEKAEKLYAEEKDVELLPRWGRDTQQFLLQTARKQMKSK